MEHDLCLYCGKASAYGLTHPTCTRPFGVDGVLSIYHYNTPLKKIIKNIKYRLVTDSIREFLLQTDPTSLYKLTVFKKMFPNLEIQSIPLHKKRERERGFNQADYFLRFFNTFLQYQPVNYLLRTRATAFQSQTQSDKERALNVENAFSLKNNTSLQGKEILLIDDIVTSGGTLKEAARVLKKAGAGKIYALSLARG
jgi:ComF family protein